MFQVVITIFVSIIQGIILFALAYYYFLLLASIPSTDFTDTLSVPTHHSFALLIPAHNEAAVISETVTRLQEMNYPKHLFDVIVVADYCRDDTALRVRRAGGICYERNEGKSGRKGYALAWLLEQVLSRESRYDAVVIFDADSRVLPNFLEVMNKGLNSGFAVLQGQHVISNPDETVFNCLAAIDMRLNNRLRNAARHNLGFSCRLMGDAMCFSRKVFHCFPWGTFSLAEDIEYGIHLMLNDIRIGYARQALSFGQAAGGWRQAERQRLRWDGGLLDLRKRLGFKLLLEGIKSYRLELVDRAIELLLPPFSMLFVLAIGLLVFLELWSTLPVLVPIKYMALVTVVWGIFPFLALLIDRAPLSSFLALIYSPVYLAWRIWIRLLALVRGQKVHWIRTPRSEEG